jgi:RNA polymerase sigma-70 factor, ECF subfamily
MGVGFSGASQKLPGAGPNHLLRAWVIRGGTGADVGPDRRLIIRAQAGDLRAFEQVLRAIEPPLRGYLGRLVGAHADDVLQETFLRIWRGLGWLRDPDLFSAWAYRIATREAQRAMRREGKREEMRADESALETLQASFADPALRLDAERCLAQVSPRARVVLVAHYFEGLSLEEVTAVAEAPLGTVKSRLASGLAQLRALMGATR